MYVKVILSPNEMRTEDQILDTIEEILDRAEFNYRDLALEYEDEE